MTKKTLLATFLLISAFASQSQAATRYVVDEVFITLRTGAGNQFAIIKSLKSGDKMELLEEDAEGFAKVRTDDGKEGWVRTQYLQEEPIASIRLERIESRLEKMKEENKQLKQELDAVKGDKKELEKERNNLQSSADKLTKQVDHMRQVSAQPIKLDEENQELRNRTVTLEQDLNMARQEIQVMKDKSDQDWFLAGAGVIVLGIIIGLILPKVRGRKKSSWDL